MEKKKKIQVYVKPNNVKVVQAFTPKNYIFYGVHDMVGDTDNVIEDRDLAQQTGQECEIQKMG